MGEGACRGGGSSMGVGACSSGEVVVVWGKGPVGEGRG